MNLSTECDDDVIRFIELLTSKIGINKMVRITVTKSGDRFKNYNIDGKAISCENFLSDRVIQCINSINGKCVNFLNRHLAIYDALNFPHEDKYSFVMIHMSYEVIT